MSTFFLLFILGCGAVMFSALVVARREVRASQVGRVTPCAPDGGQGTARPTANNFSGAGGQGGSPCRETRSDVPNRPRPPRLLELNPRLLRA